MTDLQNKSRKSRKSVGQVEVDREDLLILAYQDSEEEKKSDGQDELTAKMQSLSLRGV